MTIPLHVTNAVTFDDGLTGIHYFSDGTRILWAGDGNRWTQYLARPGESEWETPWLPPSGEARHEFDEWQASFNNPA